MSDFIYKHECFGLKLEHVRDVGYATLYLRDTPNTPCKAVKLMHRDDLIKLSIAIGDILARPGMCSEADLERLRSEVYG